MRIRTQRRLWNTATLAVFTMAASVIAYAWTHPPTTNVRPKTVAASPTRVTDSTTDTQSNARSERMWAKRLRPDSSSGDSPSRQETILATPPPRRPQLMLVSIFWAEQDAVVCVEEAGKKRQTLAEGDTIAGGKIKRIDANGVVLALGEHEFFYGIEDK